MFDATLPINAIQKLALQTRKGGVIDNAMNPIAPHAGIHLKIAQLKLDYGKATHREVGPSARYNCHGLTFAARRTAIDPGQVPKILADDGYRKLAISEHPVCGDVAVYTENGDISHSAIVVASPGGVTWVLGKWGECHEVIHPILDCPYKNSAVTFYRLMA